MITNAKLMYNRQKAAQFGVTQVPVEIRNRKVYARKKKSDLPPVATIHYKSSKLATDAPRLANVNQVDMDSLSCLHDTHLNTQITHGGFPVFNP